MPAMCRDRSRREQRMSVIGTLRSAHRMSAFGGKADMTLAVVYVR